MRPHTTSCGVNKTIEETPDPLPQSFLQLSERVHPLFLFLVGKNYHSIRHCFRARQKNELLMFDSMPRAAANIRDAPRGVSRVSRKSEGAHVLWGCRAVGCRCCCKSVKEAGEKRSTRTSGRLAASLPSFRRPDAIADRLIPPFHSVLHCVRVAKKIMSSGGCRKL